MPDVLVYAGLPLEFLWHECLPAVDAGTNGFHKQLSIPANLRHSQCFALCIAHLLPSKAKKLSSRPFPL